MIPTLPKTIEISNESMTALAGNAGSFINSAMPLVLLAVGFAVGLWVVVQIFRIVRMEIRESRRKDRELSIRIDKAVAETRRLLSN